MGGGEGTVAAVGTGRQAYVLGGISCALPGLLGQCESHEYTGGDPKLGPWCSKSLYGLGLMDHAERRGMEAGPAPSGTDPRHGWWLWGARRHRHGQGHVAVGRQGVGQHCFVRRLGWLGGS